MSYDLVEAVRVKLYPDKFNSHEREPHKRFEPLHDANKAFQVTKHVAWYLRNDGYGLVKAKEGSENNVEGYTGDIVAQPDGRHWDVLQDAEGLALPDWRKVDDKYNEPIKSRWRQPIPMPDILGIEDKEEPDMNQEELVKALMHVISNQQQMIEQTRALQDSIVKAVNELKAEVNKGVKIRF